MKIIEKNKKNKKFILLIMLLLSFFTFQTVVYSSVSSTFNITGSAAARVATDVRVTSFRIASATNSGVSNYEEFGKNHVSTGLQLPSRNATVTYYVEVTNYGNTDVGIYSISGLPSNLTYTISDYTLKNKICDDTGKCNGVAKKTFSITLKTSTYTWTGYTGDVNLTFDFRPFYKVTYEGITNNNYPTEVLSGDSLRISFKEDLNRVLISANGTQLGYYATVTNGQTISVNNITSDVVVKLKPYVAQLVRGNLDTRGSEVCIGSECFYIISTDSSTIKMLSKYNLHVGSNTTNFDFDSSSLTTQTISNATGRQSASALGSPYNARDNYTNTFPWVGVTQFASSGYWYNSSTNAMNYGYATDFTAGDYSFAYVYNNSSGLYSYFNNYKNYLTSLDVVVNDVRPIKGSELTNLGCDKYYYNCLLAPDWVRSTSYWTGDVFSTTNYTNLAVIVTSTFFGEVEYSNFGVFGARPVVELPRSEINPTPNIAKSLTIRSGDINSFGSEVCIGSECFYVLYNNSAVVTLLAKYNLQVGYRVTGWNSSTNSYTKYKITNASGKQCSTCFGARGTYEEPQFPFVGTIDFASDSYWIDPSTGDVRKYVPHNYFNEGDGGYWVYNNASTLYPYVENYKKYLESLGVVVTSSSIPPVSLISEIACAYSEDCSDLPSFMYDSSYWVGTAYGSASGGMFSAYGLNGSESLVSSNELLGLRVIISVPVAMFN